MQRRVGYIEIPGRILDHSVRCGQIRSREYPLRPQKTHLGLQCTRGSHQQQNERQNSPPVLATPRFPYPSHTPIPGATPCIGMQEWLRLVSSA